MPSAWLPRGARFLAVALALVLVALPLLATVALAASPGRPYEAVSAPTGARAPGSHGFGAASSGAGPSSPGAAGGPAGADGEDPTIDAAARIPFPPGVPMPLPVGVALYVNAVGKINEGAQTFSGSVDLRYRWTDPRLAFDAKEMATDRLEFGNEAAFAKLGQIWNPQIAIENMVEDGAQNAPGLFIYSDGSVEFIQRIKATFETKFQLAAFPFDEQVLPVVMLSSKYSINQLALLQDKEDLQASGLKDGLKIRGWKPQALGFATTRVRAWNGNFVPQMEARIGIKRVPDALIGAIFTPFLLTILVPAIVTFAIKADVNPRVTAWGASILALVALSFTFSVRFPFLPDDSLVSQVVTTGHIFQLVCLILTMTLFNPQFTEKLVKNKFMLEEFHLFLRWSLPTAFLGVLLTQTLLTAYSW